MIVETDGNLESVDVLKICGDGFTKNNINVSNCELDEVFQDKLVELYYNSHTYLSSKCLNCPVKEACGGGYLPHRYSRENGFDNPSIYCKDLFKLITHIRTSIINVLPNDTVAKSELQHFENSDFFNELGTIQLEQSIHSEFLKSFVRKSNGLIK